MTKRLVSVVLGVLVCGCSSAPGIREYSWRAEKRVGGEFSVCLSDPIVDKTTEGSSVQAELSRLLPIALAEQRIRLVPESAEVLYVIDVQATERECGAGLKTIRSATLELWVRPKDETRAFSSKVPPLAAARVLYSGEESISSSLHLDRLISRATSLMARKLRSVHENAE